MQARRRASAVMAAVAGCGLSSLAWGQATSHIYLGRADLASMDQPRVAWEMRDPDSGLTLGPPFDIGGGLLDTGANGLVFGYNAYMDFDWEELELTVDAARYGFALRTNGEPVMYEEIGVAGTDLLHVLARNNLVFTPMGDTEEYLVPNVYALGFSQDQLDAGGGNFGSFSAVLGMPLMIGKRVQIDVRPVAEFEFIESRFLAASPARAAYDYQVRLERLVAEHTGQQQPDDPLPTFADLPMVKDVVTTVGDGSSTRTMLLDTGAQMTMISTAMAEEMGVILDPDHPDTAVIDYTEVGGIGGSAFSPVIMLDRLVVQTEQGVDLVYSDVIVGVVDIPTIGGVFGMNLLTSGPMQGTPTYLDSLDLDFTGEEFQMWWQLNPGHELAAGPVDLPPQTVRWTGNVNDRWNKFNPGNWSDTLSLDELVLGSVAFKYRDGDHVIFDDEVSDLGTRTITLAGDVAPGSVVVNNSNGFYRFYGDHGARITGSGGVVKLGGSDLIFHTPNTYTGLTDVQQGKLVLAASQDIGPVQIALGASLEMRQSQRFQSLALQGGQAAFTEFGRSLHLRQLAIEQGGQLDLLDGGLIITLEDQDQLQSVLGQVNGLVASGRNGGTWDGAGIRSSLLAADPLLSKTIAVGIAQTPELGGSVGAKFTWVGDTDLDEAIGTADFAALSKGYVAYMLATQAGDTSHRPLYNTGDFNYDGVISTADFALLSKGYVAYMVEKQTGQSAAAVPEPGALTLLAALTSLAMRRRRVSIVNTMACA